MNSAQNSLPPPEERSESSSSHKVTTLDRMTESILPELKESLCCVVISASTCLRWLAVDSPNVEGARETARRTIHASNRAAEAVSRLSALLDDTNNGIKTVASSIKESSTEATGGTG
jgi:hypothetical protein